MPPEAWDRAFSQMRDIFFNPELERRSSAGELPEPFNVFIAQILFMPDRTNKVLFNDEVRGDALLLAPRNIEAGEAMLVSDMAHMKVFDLPDELLDCGHFTVCRAGEGWRMSFNFLRGRAKARDMLILAAEFVDAARESATKGHAGPSVDNLFSAAELVSKAGLILHISIAVESKCHGRISSAINNWARLGNIDAAFVALFNKLGQQRPNARYGDRKSRPPAPDQDDFEIVSLNVV